jgi:hypothetical protein
MNASTTQSLRRNNRTTTPPRPPAARAQKAPPGSVTKDKDGYNLIENPKHTEDGWRLGEKVVFHKDHGWLMLAEYQQLKKASPAPMRPSERAPYIPPVRPYHRFR